MSKKAVCGVLLLVCILATPAFGAGYEVIVKGQNSVVPKSTGVFGQGFHPAIHLPLSENHLLFSRSSNQTSVNWAGYVISSSTGSVTDVNGSWIVPRVLCSASDSYSSFWVGIDGWNDSTVEQIGTDSDCQGGSPTYYAWYEFYPGAGAPIDNVTVSAGDVISAMVSCQMVEPRCAFSIVDVKDDQSFSYSQSFGPSAGILMESAEWIAEAPSSLSGQLLPLTDFGTVYFGQDSTGVVTSNSATVNGTSGPISSFGAAVVEVTMVTLVGGARARPSQLSQDGTSFSVAWVEPGSALSPPAISVSPTMVDMGQSAKLSTKTSFTGGVVPYTCQWLEEPPGATGFGDFRSSFTSGCTLSSKPSMSTGALTDSGVWKFELQVTDTIGVAVVSPPASVAVKPALVSPTISVSPTSIGIGQAATLSVKTSFTGGVSSYTCQWLEKSPLAASFVALGSSFKSGCTPSSRPSMPTGALTTAGTWSFELRVTDSASASVASAPAAVTVSKDPSKTTVSCTPSSVPAVSSTKVTCKATVGGHTPTGKLSWSQSGTGSVSFISTTCTLSAGSCSLTMTGLKPGPLTVTVTYSGDSNNQVSSGTTALAVGKASSHTTISCTPTSVPPSATTVVCKVKVTGYSPTGKVTFSQSGTGSVSFATATCALAAGSCSVKMTGGRVGTVTITATYSGDSDNQASSGTAMLTITKTAA